MIAEPVWPDPMTVDGTNLPNRNVHSPADIGANPDMTWIAQSGRE